MTIHGSTSSSGGLRLLYLTAETWPTFRVDVAVLFGRLLPRLGISSDLVTMRSADPHADDTWGGGAALLSPPSSSPLLSHVRSLWHYTIELFRADWSTYDAVQVRDLPLPAAFALLFARWHRRPFFYWMSFLVPEGHIELARERGLEAGIMRFVFSWTRGRLGRLLLYRWVLPRADHVFVQSDRMKAQMIEKGFNADRMTPVPMGVDLFNFTTGPVDPAIAERLKGRRTLIYMGVLERSRRLEILFEMMALLRRQHPDLLLLMVGDTVDEPQRAHLRRLANVAGVSDLIIWTGWVPMSTAWGYAQRCEVGLSPIPRGELLDVSTPTKIIEFLALGLPVVCSDSPDQASIMEACGAGLCVPYDAQSFAEAVDMLLKLPPGARQESSRAGRQYVAENRDYAVLAAGLAQKYRTLLGAKRLPAGP